LLLTWINLTGIILVRLIPSDISNHVLLFLYNLVYFTILLFTSIAILRVFSFTISSCHHRTIYFILIYKFFFFINTKKISSCSRWRYFLYIFGSLFVKKIILWSVISIIVIIDIIIICIILPWGTLIIKTTWCCTMSGIIFIFIGKIWANSHSSTIFLINLVSIIITYSLFLSIIKTLYTATKSSLFSLNILLALSIVLSGRQFSCFRFWRSGCYAYIIWRDSINWIWWAMHCSVFS
jgi:hypothetical protein